MTHPVLQIAEVVARAAAMTVAERCPGIDPRSAADLICEMMVERADAVLEAVARAAARKILDDVEDDRVLDGLKHDLIEIGVEIGRAVEDNITERGNA